MSHWVTRTVNDRMIREIIMELWEWLRDDSLVNTAEWEPRIDLESRWYVSWHDGDIFGVYWARRINFITWEIHTNIRRKYWGSGLTVQYAKEALDFIFDDTRMKKAVATIPTSSPQVLDYARAVGFEDEGICKQSFRKNGKVYDQIYLGITYEQHTRSRQGVSEES